ncbi:hypothetical protein HPP92_000592 [Vanilla planifolia]|uniref:Uncharacterized protein n=1 Tax=Vanilla planifolia TaxID=51239 RepID=A0A835S543_VANPL|nr:hypothetical protein HPP92_000592 [Vanilla planifolia]
MKATNFAAGKSETRGRLSRRGCAHASIEAWRRICRECNISSSAASASQRNAVAYPPDDGWRMLGRRERLQLWPSQLITEGRGGRWLFYKGEGGFRPTRKGATCFLLRHTLELYYAAIGMRTSPRGVLILSASKLNRDFALFV